jgi:hypothetical protein
MATITHGATTSAVSVRTVVVCSIFGSLGVAAMLFLASSSIQAEHHEKQELAARGGTRISIVEEEKP